MNHARAAQAGAAAELGAGEREPFADHPQQRRSRRSVARRRLAVHSEIDAHRFLLTCCTGVEPAASPPGSYSSQQRTPVSVVIPSEAFCAAGKSASRGCWAVLHGDRRRRSTTARRRLGRVLHATQRCPARCWVSQARPNLQPCFTAIAGVGQPPLIAGWVELFTRPNAAPHDVGSRKLDPNLQLCFTAKELPPAPIFPRSPRGNRRNFLPRSPHACLPSNFDSSRD